MRPLLYSWQYIRLLKDRVEREKAKAIVRSNSIIYSLTLCMGGALLIAIVFFILFFSVYHTYLP